MAEGLELNSMQYEAFMEHATHRKLLLVTLFGELSPVPLTRHQRKCLALMGQRGPPVNYLQEDLGEKEERIRDSSLGKSNGFSYGGNDNSGGCCVNRGRGEEQLMRGPFNGLSNDNNNNVHDYECRYSVQLAYDSFARDPP